MGEAVAVSRWSSAGFAPRQRFDALRDAISATHLPFDIAPPAGRDPAEDLAEMSWQALADTSLIACLCGPCHGQRARRELGLSKQPFYGVLYIQRGQELVRQAGREAYLRAGHFLLWDSRRPLEFSVPETLSKLTLLVPQGELEALLPDVADLVATPIDGRSGPGALFATHLRALSRDVSSVPEERRPVLQRATLELLITALMPLRRSAAPLHRLATLARVQDYILANLRDEQLTPDSVAAAFNISPRHLHRLFETSDMTLERWLWHQRLLRCRQDLRTQPHLQVSQIAYRWGFNDAAHFSRAFREQFGVSPRDFRKESRTEGRN